MNINHQKYSNIKKYFNYYYNIDFKNLKGLQIFHLNVITL